MPLDEGSRALALPPTVVGALPLRRQPLGRIPCGRAHLQSFALLTFDRVPDGRESYLQI